VKKRVHIQKLSKQKVIKDIVINNVANNNVKKGYTAYNNYKRLFNNLLRKRPKHKPALSLQNVKLAYYNILSYIISSLKIKEKNKRNIKGYNKNPYRRYKDKFRKVSQKGLVIRKSRILLGKNIRKRSKI
jgi:hypothetical protein